MATIKKVNRLASVAFSPDKPYFAAGTMAGAVDISFSTSANLEIFKLDFQSNDPQLPLLGAIPSPTKRKIGDGRTKQAPDSAIRILHRSAQLQP